MPIIMKKVLAALFAVALGLNLSAQVPNYVPTEGLVAWYPFNGNANDESGNGNDGVAENVTAEFDRFGNVNGAFGFQGQNCCGQPDELVQQVVIENSIINLGGDYSVSAWFLSSNIEKYQQCLFNSIPHTGFVVEYNNEHAPDVTTVGLGPGNAYWNTLYQHGPFADYTENQWYQVVFVKQNANFHLYIDGALDWESTYGFADVYNLEVGIRFGSIGGGHQIMNGSLDDCGIWNRALTEEEVLALYNTDPPISGCTDSTACNFDSEATSDDGSCIPSGCMETDACNYNALAECEGEACDYTCCPGPGCCSAGMYWDYDLEQCMNYETCQEDLDGDGVIGINDLMELLSSFGTMCEEPETGEFTCGDAMNYHGYDYATVQIGEQCWFAENLRNEHYANGDAIPGELSNSEWENADDTNLGAQAIYNNDASNLADYGRLYNWYAVDDARGLCPSDWHVPTDGEFMTLEMELGMSESEANSDGWRGTDQGMQMKSSPGDNPPWNGTNTSGFSGLAGGFRIHDGVPNALGGNGYFWSASSNGIGAWFRILSVEYFGVQRSEYNQGDGMSIRCLKDSE